MRVIFSWCLHVCRIFAGVLADVGSHFARLWWMMASNLYWFDVLVPLLLLYGLLGLPASESLSLTLLAAACLAWPHKRQKVSVFLLGFFLVHFVFRDLGHKPLGYLLG